MDLDNLSRDDLINTVKSLEFSNNAMLAIFDSMDLPIYVSDVETGDLLFANKSARTLYNETGGRSGFNQPDSGKCWEVIHGRASRCENCKVNLLLENQQSGKYVWEHYNSSSRSHYKVHDIMIPWANGIRAHLQYSVDITAIKEYQNRLEHVASTDAFTSTLNRGSLLPRLRDMLQKAHAYNNIVTICFVDIDRLKYTNDTFGHAKGDILISKVVEKLQDCVRKRDIIGRYGGDEFIVALMNCDKGVAEQKISEARAQLIEESKNKKLKLSFSFGIVDSSEEPFSDGDSYVEKLIEIADKRMLAYKQKTFGSSSRC